MKKYTLAALLLLSPFTFHLSPLFAQTQSGVVRTVSRPDAPSQRLQGVVVRVKGDYNPVLSDEQGAFQVLMPGQKNGAPYSIAGIMKGGYELREPELVGRQLPFSSSVPVEITMVSKRQLQRDKQRIEQAARESVERRYEEQMNALSEQLAQAKVSEQEYMQRLSELEGDYDKYETMIEQMADRYARADYQGMSSADSLIMQAIEQGDLNLAQERILAKGDPAEREKKMQRIRQLADAQRDELANDYYNLHSIQLIKLHYDSAFLYLLRRAELDTTNAKWQLDAGNFCDKMARKGAYEQALLLFRRAARYATANEGPNALLTAQAHNNIAYALTRSGNYQEALQEQHIATRIYMSIYGEQHQLTAARLTNLGVIHFYLKQADSALYYFNQAEEVYVALEKAGEKEPAILKLHSQLLNNIAAIDMAQKHPEKAYERVQKGLAIVPQEAEDDRIKLLDSMGGICKSMKRYDEARNYWQQALDKALKLYGPDHAITAKLQGLMDKLTSK